MKISTVPSPVLGPGPASVPTSAEAEARFDWPVCHEAENLILQHLEGFLARNTFARRLAARMREETGTLFLDWVDHLILPASQVSGLRAVGYVEESEAEAPAGWPVWHHPEAMLPRVMVADGSLDSTAMTVALRCESLSDFLLAHGLSGEPSGEPLTRYRQVVVNQENGSRFVAVERRGYRGFIPARSGLGSVYLLRGLEYWRTRPREFAEDATGYGATLDRLQRLVGWLGKDLACHAVFQVEREWWQKRNHAARVQKARQDLLGLGWANHDHHTFRSSREHFVDLMRALEWLGFERRERYYAGAQAGWGAQILEQPTEQLVAFCDVDLEPEETSIDFSRQPLPPSHRLGTIGLWVGLHGESFLQAGLHHLECRFDYALLRDQLAAAGVATMKPFSDFEFLKQAFTEGERWTVRPERIQRLLDHGRINPAQAETFRKEGAIGSHLENLQRKGGFKGFNQKSVSAIITATDPRRKAD